MFDPEQLKALVLQRLPDAQIELEDLTGTRDHYRLTVVSSGFEGLSPVAQHRLVYATLGAHVGAEIHALALNTYTPDAWQKRQ